MLRLKSAPEPVLHPGAEVLYRVHRLPVACALYRELLEVNNMTNRFVSSDSKDMLYLISGMCALTFAILGGVASVLALISTGF